MQNPVGAHIARQTCNKYNAQQEFSQVIIIHNFVEFAIFIQSSVKNENTSKKRKSKSGIDRQAVLCYNVHSIQKAKIACPSAVYVRFPRISTEIRSAFAEFR